jgi:two-component system NtrC family sensor kinase
VAGGDLARRLPERSDDELGDLARSFNKMTAEVAGVQAEIEERVRCKTVELERVHKSLRGSEKMASIGKLAATVAHEINNPLFGILTYARLVRRALSKVDVEGCDEVAGQLQIIERESKRCGDLVKNLLTFSRQAPSHREPRCFTVVHCAVLWWHKLDLQSIELRKENLAQDLRPWGVTPTRSNGDSGAADERLEAMPKGGTLKVATDSPLRNRVWRALRTREAAFRRMLRIFDPFFTTGRPKPHGTGPGGGRQHRGQHAGEISVRSAPGEGTGFTVAHSDRRPCLQLRRRCWYQVKR